MRRMRWIALLAFIFLGFQMVAGLGAVARPMATGGGGTSHNDARTGMELKNKCHENAVLLSGNGPYNFDWLNPNHYTYFGYPGVFDGKTIYNYSQGYSGGFGLWKLDITNTANPIMTNDYQFEIENNSLGYSPYMMNGIVKLADQFIMLGTFLRYLEVEHTYEEMLFTVDCPTSGNIARLGRCIGYGSAGGESKIESSENHLFWFDQKGVAIASDKSIATSSSALNDEGVIFLGDGSDLRHVCSAGNLLYLCMGKQGVWVYDITTQANPIYRSTIPPPAVEAHNIAAKGNLLFLIDRPDPASPYNDFYIYDVHDPANPKMLSSMLLPDGWGNNITLGGGLVYVTTEMNGHLYAIDVTNPIMPVIRARFDSNCFDSVHYSEGKIVTGGDKMCILRYHPSGRVNISNMNRTSYRVDYFRPGNTPYADQSTEFNAPGLSRIKEQAYIMTRNSDLDSTASGFVSFDIDQPSTVIVAYDERARHLPSWLANWPKTGQVLSTTDATAPGRVLYSRTFPAGRVRLGGNRDEDMPKGRNVMYSVFVVPNRTGVERWGAFE